MQVIATTASLPTMFPCNQLQLRFCYVKTKTPKETTYAPCLKLV